MDNESKAPDLGPERLAQLWDIGSEVHIEATPAAADSEERYTELLCDRLAQQLPLNPEETQNLVSRLPEELGTICRELRPFSGGSIGLLLTHPETDPQVLERIKDHAKEQGEAVASKVERDVAKAVYFAAIAAALVFHNTRISKQSDRHLARAFDALSKRQAVPSELRSLFQQACRGSKSEPGTSKETGDRP